MLLQGGKKMAGSQSVGTTIQIDGESAWVGATVSWDNNLNVTVSNIYCNGMSDDRWTWRITGSYSIDNDRNVYAGEGVGYSFKSPKDGKTFVFGASPAVNNVSTGAWTNTNGSFVVSSGSSGGGDDDDEGGGGTGSGGNTGTACLLSIFSGNGTSVEVRNMNGNYLSNMSTVYSGDYIAIKCVVTSGYTLSSFNVSGATYAYDYDGYKVYRVTSNVYIHATAESGGSGGNTGGGGGGDFSDSGSIPLSPSSKAWDGEVVWEVRNGKLYLSLYMWKTDGTNRPSSGGYTNSGYVRLNGSEVISFTYDQIEYDRTQYGETYVTNFSSDRTYSISALVGGLSNTGYAGTTLSGSGVINSSSGGGDSGDSGGGSSGGGTNSGLKEYEFTALGVRAKATYTSGPEVTITLLSWDGYGSIPYWRIKGVYSEGDTNTYLEQNNKSSNSFDAYGGYDDGGKNYIFQVCKDGNWNNDGGNASKFHVDFSLAGEGGGEIVDSYTMHFSEGEGTNLTVTRISSTYGAIGTMYANGDIYYDDIWANDLFEIVVEAQEGYQLNELIVDGLQYTNGMYIFSGNRNASITTSATLIASARIFNKNTSSWDMYAPYIYNGSSWNRYRPYIYNGYSWDTYS